MKEYCIYIRRGRGTPYILHIYNNLQSAKLKLNDIVSVNIERDKPYFVDNDFFDNKYNSSYSSKMDYYQIQEREITSWITAKDVTPTKDKLLLFSNYK